MLGVLLVVIRRVIREWACEWCGLLVEPIHSAGQQEVEHIEKLNKMLARLSKGFPIGDTLSRVLPWYSVCCPMFLSSSHQSSRSHHTDGHNCCCTGGTRHELTTLFPGQEDRTRVPLPLRITVGASTVPEVLCSGCH